MHCNPTFDFLIFRYFHKPRYIEISNGVESILFIIQVYIKCTESSIMYIFCVDSSKKNMERRWKRRMDTNISYLIKALLFKIMRRSYLLLKPKYILPLETYHKKRCFESIWSHKWTFYCIMTRPIIPKSTQATKWVT